MKKLFLTILILTAIAVKTYAVRPFITDDGVVTGRGNFQWEGWAYIDKSSREQWNQWTYGITDRWEMALGGVWGFEKPEFGCAKFSFSTPLLETKFLLHEYQAGKLPGIALALGTALPYGTGAFVPEGYGAYSFLAVTQVFDENENFTMHGNIGLNYLNVDKKHKYISYWGIGAQVKAYKGLHVVGEIISGDPYTPGTGLAYQAGFRYFISDLIQVDAEIGQGLAGKDRIPFWFGCGFRILIEDFAKKKKIKNL